MTLDEMERLFDKYEDEFLMFSKVENPPSKRPDLTAFLLIDQLCPSVHDIVSSAEHDEIWLDVVPEELASKATEEQILTLIRCGIRMDEYGFAMFV